MRVQHRPLTPEEIEDSHEIGHFLLDYDRERNSRDKRGGDSLHQRLGHFLVRQAAGRRSSSTVIENGVRNDGLVILLEDRKAANPNQRRNHI